jgi:hypothetical protein
MIAGSKVPAMIENLRPLTQEQRQSARKAAREAVIRAIGPKPAREQFNYSAISKYPPFVTRLIFLLCLVLLLAAFTPSAIRLYVIGSRTFGQAVSNDVAMTAVGFATVLSAEIGQIVFSPALATLGTSRSARTLLITSMAITTIISLVGNVQLALSGHEHSPFAWPESLAPPVIVLATAYVIKEQILEAIEVRHANERAYQSALDDWKIATSAPENYPAWSQFHANGLQDALRKANARRKDILDQLTIEDWRIVVGREMHADRWYQDAEQDEVGVFALSPATESITAGRNGNDHRPKVSVSAV